MGNKLFCTFSEKNNIDSTIKKITDTYSILYNKIFVLETDGSNEYICTYNVDTINIRENILLDNTILTHRRKQTNTLYTINALNNLIISLNNGKLDNSFIINWDDYRNSIMLTRSNQFVKMNTKVYNIVVIN